MSKHIDVPAELTNLLEVMAKNVVEQQPKDVPAFLVDFLSTQTEARQPVANDEVNPELTLSNNPSSNTIMDQTETRPSSDSTDCGDSDILMKVLTFHDDCVHQEKAKTRPSSGSPKVRKNFFLFLSVFIVLSSKYVMELNSLK